MKRLFAMSLGVMLFGLAGFSQAADVDDYPKKIVGIWEVTKSESNLPNGTTVEFTKDGKLSVIIKGDDTKLSGTYKLDKDTLNVKLTGSPRSSLREWRQNRWDALSKCLEISELRQSVPERETAVFGRLYP